MDFMMGRRNQKSMVCELSDSFEANSISTSTS